MDQTGYPGVDENTFLLAMHGRTPPAAEGEERPGITTDSIAGSSTAGFGRTQTEGQAAKPTGTRKKATGKR